MGGHKLVLRLFFLSSVKAMSFGDRCVDETWDGIPSGAYGEAKRQAEAEVIAAGKSFGMHVVNLRLAMVYGRGDGKYLSHGAWHQGRVVPTASSQTGNEALVHIDDVVAAVRHVAEKPKVNGKPTLLPIPMRLLEEKFMMIRRCFG